MSESKYMSIEEAAEFSRSSHWTVRSKLSKGVLQRYKFGSKTLILRADLMRLIHAESPAEAAARNVQRERRKTSKSAEL